MSNYSLLPVVRNLVKPWWDNFGSQEGFNDVGSYRNMILIAKDDIYGLDKAFINLTYEDDPEIWSEVQENITSGEKLIDLMNTRIKDILKGTEDA